jgi:hypothetical protein
MKRVTRIAYNSADWRHPTGDAAMLEMAGSYNEVNGYGHEDWLFRDEWQIDGWRYAFIQGIGRSHDKLVRERKPLDVTLFTVQPDRRRRYVASIEALECLDADQAESALDAFKENGWLSQMEREILETNGNVEALGNAKWAKHILNVRFQLRNVHRFANDSFAAADDPVQRLTRYVLTNVTDLQQKFLPTGKRVGLTDFPNLAGHTRSGTGPILVSPEHARMQRLLLEELQTEFPHGDVVREENFIDVRVRTIDELRLYEIKSDLAPRTVLRLAIGQLLEYAYFQATSEGRRVTLVAVGRNPLSDPDRTYLAHLRDNIGLPLEYRVVHV